MCLRMSQTFSQLGIVETQVRILIRNLFFHSFLIAAAIAVLEEPIVMVLRF